MEKNQIGNCKKMNLLDIHKLIKFILETGIRGGDLPVFTDLEEPPQTPLSKEANRENTIPTLGCHGQQKQ